MNEKSAVKAPDKLLLIPRRERVQHRKNVRFGILLTIPALLVLIGIQLYPLLYSLAVSFTDYRLLKDGTSFVGLSNFVQLLKDADFHNALTVTVKVTFFSLLFEFLLGLLVALTLFSIGRGKQFFRTLFLMPMMLSPVVVGLMFRYMFNDEFGIVNTMLLKTNLLQEKIPWLLETNWALATIILLDIWATTPLVIILLYSGLINIPQELYEAGRIDGAGSWKAFWRITLPLLKPIIIVTFIIRGMDVFRVFDSIFVLTGGGPVTSTESLAIYLYRMNWKSNEVGMASAGSFIMLMIMAAASLLVIKILSDRREQA